MPTTSAPRIVVRSTETEAGHAAGRAAAISLRAAIAARGRARVVFAAAPSQEAMLAELTNQAVDWSAIEAFHMDEYIGLPDHHPQSFGQWLADRLPGDLAAFERITTSANPEMEMARYSARLSGPIDLVCLGIGVNGHIAFNEPGASFTQTEKVCRVELDEASRQQQVEDGCFATLEEVPTTALTLTIPTLVAGADLVCTVLGSRKAKAVRRALTGPVDESCPASILQTRPDARIFLDAAAAADLESDLPD